MKDYLQKHKFLNVFPNNRTQTMYLRFLKMPTSKLETAFTKNKENFKNNTKLLETKYTKFVKQLGEELNAIY